MRPSTSFPGAVAVGAALSLFAGAVASADEISNSLDGSIDAVAEVMPLTVGGANGTTTLYVNPTGSDGKPGCNLTGSTTLTLEVSSSSAAVATVSPSSVTFTSCGDTKALTVAPVAAGSATISARLTSKSTEGSFDLAPASFAVHVTQSAIANTAPTVAVEGVAEGASYVIGTVPAATCEVTDAEDGNSSFPATLSAISGPYGVDGIGSQTASCSYTDRGGLAVSASETYSVVDPSAPSLSSVLTPATPDGDNGWYRSDVSLAWTVTEPQSPSSLVTTGCVDQSITADQAATTYTCSATSAGGEAGEQSVTVKRDATAPSVTYTSASGTLGNNGWYTSAVTATFTGTDALSGPASTSKQDTSTGEGSAVVVESPAFTDDAGNATGAGADRASFSIDLTDPTAAFDSTIADVYFGAVPAAPTCTSSDDISGPAACEVTGYSTDVGTHTLTATATDNAGRTGTVSQTYTVRPWTLTGFYQPVDMNGVVNTVKGGSTVPLKFELFAGTTELTDTASISTLAKTTTCGASAATDEIEATATGGTSLRYDTTAGQFVFNWQTPKTVGYCYSVTVTAKDGSSLTALFKTR